MRARIRPFRIPSNGRLVVRRWTRIHGGLAVDLPEFIPDWDAATDLHVGAEVEADVDAVRADTGLAAEPIALITSWRARATALRGAGSAMTVARSGLHRADVTIPGRDAGGRLELSVALILAADRIPESFVASREGTVLWEATRHVDLEGSAGRFPVEVADFASIPGKSSDAVWFLDWDPVDLSMPLLGGIRLVVNSRRARVVSALRSESTDPDAPAIRDAVLLDVAQTIVEGALSNPEFGDDSSYDSGTIGEAVRDLLDAAFGRPISSLKALYGGRRSDLQSHLQAYLNVFADREQ